ncbi:hypothetical protein [Streptomyces avidinii]|uniref:Uncharacterized protein n=1 Tax=Streptomyces avidinii TaxID=1895 RepID=A0ABS4KYZ3_STRAV|nr:hypothetical protein [Streptomyces avidinii]MBP2035252.1 hypothetical protein [Streptomyces avidinii]GGZ03767.1 hypothetical protein GCM10010343_32060 [Streptomyces avidinii]
MATEHTGRHARPGPRPGGGWSAVVYGRTYRIDRWWRALPDGATPGGPLGRAVLAVVAGGTRLDVAPRFVLQRGLHGVLVGGACQVPLLGPDMAHDEHGRPLYGFVGWHHPDRAAAHGLPGLGELEASFLHWAGPTYRAWAAPAWDVALAADAETLTSTAAAAPWAVRERPADPAAARYWPEAHPADVHLLPAGQAHGLWDAALAAGPTADCLLTAGWQLSRDAREPGLTHACCADVTEYRRTPRTAPPAPARAPAQAPAAAPEPAPKPAPKPIRKPVPEPERQPERRTREEARKGFWARASEVWRSVGEADRPDGRPPAPRPRPAPQRRTSRRPTETESYLTGSAAYEPEPSGPGLLGRSREVAAEQASFEGYFGAFGTPGAEAGAPPAAGSAAGSAPASASGEVPGPRTGPGSASTAEGRGAGRPGAAPAPGGPVGHDAGTGTPSGPGGPAGAWGALAPDTGHGPGATAAAVEPGSDPDAGSDSDSDPDPGSVPVPDPDPDPYRSHPGGSA